MSNYGAGSYGAAATYRLVVTSNAATPTPAPQVVRVSPTEAVSLKANNGMVEIVIPAGALGVTETVTLSWVPEPLPPPSALGEQERGLLAFSLGAVTSSGQQITQLARPLSVTIRYCDADVVGLNENTLAVCFKDGQGKYVALASQQRSPERNEIVVTLDHLSYFMVEGSVLHRMYLPIIFTR